METLTIEEIELIQDSLNVWKDNYFTTGSDLTYVDELYKKLERMKEQIK